MVMAERPMLVVCLEQPKPHLRVLWGLEHVEPSILDPMDVEGAIFQFTKDVHQKRLPPSCQVKCAWLEFGEFDVPTAAAIDAAVKASQPGEALVSGEVARDGRATLALVTIAPLFLVQPLLHYPYKSPVQSWILLRERSRRAGLNN
mmetsp:Transcript_55556/g.166523  ORF Transcript_55556/g.166523 Transcript_55556/m.166523 type:complete len:146 (-) Transcript_55556:2198-2635(-)